MTEIYLVGGMALVTFLIRYGLYALGERVRFPHWLERSLAYVPPAVLTAIIVPAVLLPNGETIELSWQNAYLVGAIAACLIAWFGRNLLLTIGGGMLVFLLWQALLAGLV